MKLDIEYSADFFDAGRQLAGENAFLFLQAGSVEVEGVNETWGLYHISSAGMV